MLPFEEHRHNVARNHLHMNASVVTPFSYSIHTANHGQIKASQHGYLLFSGLFYHENINRWSAVSSWFMYHKDAISLWGEY